jgi:endonuclease III
MPKSDLKTRAKKIKDALFKAYPDATCALSHRNAFELAVATILSAQCTDERVNIVTKTLFKKYPNAKAFAEADIAQLEIDIRTTGFYRNKARSIQEFSRAIVEQFKGEVPQDLDALVKLPGIGRKTANVILGTFFGLATGVVVDTHVSRLSQRMGLTKQEDPVKIELDLMELIPEKDWILFGHSMIWHGRKVCIARKPKCSICPVEKECPKIGVEVPQ